jgi:hypothetical protein
MENPERSTRKLQEAGTDLPFSIPPRYFDDFPARLQVRIDQETSSGKMIFLRFFEAIKPAIGLAAAFAAVFILVYWPAKWMTRQIAYTAKNQNNLNEKVIDLVEHVDDQTFFSLLEYGGKTEAIDYETLENYVAANFSDFDIYLETHN